MKKTIRLLGILMIALFVVSGCNSKASTQETTTSQAKKTTIDKVDWPFYEIKAKDETIGYILGSIHIGHKDMYPFPKEITKAVASSSAVISEVTFSSLTSPASAKLAQKAIEEEPHILTNLSEEEKERLNEKLASYDYSIEDVEGLNYFGLMTMLQAKYMDISQALFGVDMQLSKEAQKNDIDNLGFETVYEQYQLINEATSGYLDEEDWIDAIPSLAESKAENEELLEMYISGELETNFSELFQDNDYEGSIQQIV